MSAKRSSLSRSKRGFAATLVGALVLLGLLIYGLVSVLGHVELVVEYVGPIVSFVGTGPGVLLSVTFAVLLILWAVRTRRKNEAGYAAPSSEPERERARLRSALQKGERELEWLRSELQKGEREFERLRSKLREGERERERLRSETQKGKRERERLRSALRESERKLERLRSETQRGAQELERLRWEPQEDERERERLRSENEQLRAQRDALKEKVTIHDSRVALKQELNAAYRDGLHLRGGGGTHSRRRRTNRGRTPDDEAATKWAIRTNELIKEALGEGEARRFLGTDARGSGDPSATEEQKQLNGRLNRLSELIQRVDSLQPLELRPGFKDQERVGSR